MTSKIDKSLIEVLEMKSSSQKAFEESGLDNYIDFIKFEIKEIENNYNFKVDYCNKNNKNKLKSA